MDVAAERIATDHAQDHHAGEGPGKAAQDGPVEGFDPLLVVTDQEAVAVRQGHGEHPDRLKLAIALRGLDRGPTDDRAARRQATGQYVAIGSDQAIVQRARHAIALAHCLHDPVQALGAKLLGQGRGFRLDAGVELFR